jgi:hypothetical protein
MTNQARRFERAVMIPLTETLQRFRARTDKPNAHIARDSWLDESYVSRLLSQLQPGHGSGSTPG